MHSSTPRSIAKLQRIDGSFPTRSSTEEEPPDSAIITLHALLLDLLQDRADMAAVTTRLTQYIVDSLHLHDFDKTLCDIDTRAVFHALAALYEYDPSLILPDTLAKCTAFLTTHELATGGPYVNALSKVQTADLATNISISRFIHDVGGPFPTLLSYIDANSADEVERSRYFVSAWPLRIQLAKMHRAAGVDVSDGQGDGSSSQDHTPITDWAYRNPWRPSDALYGMEALTLARNLPEAVPVPAVEITTPNTWQRPHAELVRRAMTYYDNTAVTAGMQRALSRVARADRSYEIGLLALRFAPSLKDKQPSKDTLEDLGIANLYNWAAYTIYDDILDDDAESSQLPIANIALRRSVQLFSKAVPIDSYKSIVHEIFNTVDAANIWELAHCRFPVHNDTISINSLPDYDRLQNLYGRSLTHSLPVIGTLIAAGVPSESDMLTAVTNAFKQYLIVRQLSDDLHDWQEDLEEGHMSFVVSSLLRHAHVMPGNYALHTLIPNLQQVYFQKTLSAIGKSMLKRSAEAHTLLRSVSLPLNTVIDKLIDGYEQSTHRMLDEHQRMTSFLKAYKP